MKILKRILEKNKKSWNSKFPLAMWDDRVTMKKEIGCAPFDLVYGIHARMPKKNLLEMYKLVQLYDDDLDDEMQLRIKDLIKLDETRRESTSRNAKMQLQVKNLYDKKVVERRFELDDLALLWNARLEDKGKHGKFDPIFLGHIWFMKSEDQIHILSKISLVLFKNCLFMDNS